MPAKGPVSIPWQIIFAIISPINLWAFYRIKKLRLYALYVITPSIVVSIVVMTGVSYEMGNPQIENNVMDNYPESTVPSYMVPIEPQVGKYNTGFYMIINIVTSVGLTILSICLVVKWSRLWNEQF